METLAGPFYVAAFLLVVGGVAKLARPATAAAALRGAGLPGGRRTVRVAGAAEVVVGLAAIVTGSRLAAVALAVAYLGFTGFVVLAMRRSGVSSCGCFGRADAPPGWIHVAVDLAAVVAAAAVAFAPIGSMVVLLDGRPLWAAALVTYVGLAVYLSYVALTALPRTLAARA